MKLNFNVRGAERKSLAGAVSTALNAPTKYLGAPSFAYEVGGYHIDKMGVLTGLDNDELRNALAKVGFEATAEESGGDAVDSLTVEYPLDGFTPETFDNLTKMITAKEALLKATLRVQELPIHVDDGKISFPWFKLNDPNDAVSYTQFVSALCRVAKEKKRVTACPCGLTENPKYAMRCWLLSLGLIGDTFKNTRKLLLSRLDGNGSFKQGKRTDRKPESQEVCR